MARKKKIKQDPPLLNSNLKVFKQHGFEPTDQAGDNQVVGDCIFCGSGKKPSFYVNIETKAWDCKRCGAHGGFQKFLLEVSKWCCENVTRKQLKELAENRSLNVSTLKAHDVGYNIKTKSFVIPIWDVNNDHLQDLRIYKNKRLISSSGCNVGLFGGDVLNLSNRNEIKTVWLVEGEWDKMAWWEVLQKNDIEDEIVVSVPGAGTFKNEWLPLFSDRIVNTIYDNDHDIVVNGKSRMGAGIAGAIKVHNLLRTVTKHLGFVHWDETLKNGFDLRDFYIKKKLQPKRTYRAIQRLINPFPKRYEETESAKAEIPNAEKYTGEGCSIEEVYAVFNKYLKLKKSNKMIDVVLATIIANRLSGDPLWLFIVGPSGCGKSEMLMSLNDFVDIKAISSLTPNTLISGANFAGGADPSLVPKLNGKVLVIKDFTTIMGMNSTAMNEIISQLRDAYDGECAKPFGNGQERNYESRFGLISGVTGMVDVFSDGLTALGERFIRYQIPLDKSIAGEAEVLDKVFENTSGSVKSDMQPALREIINKFLDHDFGDPPEITMEYKRKIICLAQWTSKLRGSVIRDLRTNEIAHKPMPEYATRLTHQFARFTQGLGMVHRVDSINEEQYHIVREIAVGSPSRNNERLLRKMVSNGVDNLYTIKQVEKFLGLPPMSAKKVSDDLSVLGVLYKRKNEKIDALGNRFSYGITKELKHLMKGANIYGLK